MPIICYYRRITSGDDVALFWWSSDVQEKLLAMWADFFLLYEALDEVQVSKN